MSVMIRANALTQPTVGQTTLPADDPTAVRRPRCLAEILLGYLARPCVTMWPGADGVTLEEVLDSYPLAVAVGQAPGLDQLLVSHPEMAQPLEAFFASAWK